MNLCDAKGLDAGPQPHAAHFCILGGTAGGRIGSRAVLECCHGTRCKAKEAEGYSKAVGQGRAKGD